MRVHLTNKSNNRKVGKIPVSTTEAKSCPSTCSWKDKGCYAKYGPLSMHWKRVKTNGLTWLQFCKKIQKLPENTLWRHNQAGDLAGKNNKIDNRALTKLIEVNKGKRGWTYTHYPMALAHNRKAVKAANANGFTINLSADNLEQADSYVDLGIAPVSVVLPSEDSLRSKVLTPRNRVVVVCPASRDGIEINCQKCQLCAVSSRKVIVGFPAHSSAKNYVSQRASLKILNNKVN